MTGVYVPLEMTWRAKFYLCIAAFRHGSFALTAWLLAGMWPTADTGIPLWAWGLVFAFGSLHLVYSAWTGSEGHARVALALSAVITSIWAGVFIAFFVSGEGSPVGAILFTSLTLKDLVICGEPLRSPFEPIIREYVERDGG